MNRTKYNQLVEKLVAEELELAAKKGKDYAGDADVCANFKRAADNLGISKYQIWGVYANKHWDAINAFCKNGKVESEPLRERAKDVRIYLQLLLAMFEEDQENG